MKKFPTTSAKIQNSYAIRHIYVFKKTQQRDSQIHLFTHYDLAMGHVDS